MSMELPVPPAMSLLRDSTRCLLCGTGYEAVSHETPWPTRPAAPAGARIDTCCTATVAKSPTGPRTSHSPRTAISFRGRRVVSQAGVFTRAYLRNAATCWSYERALLHRIPAWSFAWHSHRYSANLCPLSWRIQIGSRVQQYSDWIASLSKIDPQPAQLNDVDLLGCPLSWRIQSAAVYSSIPIG